MFLPKQFDLFHQEENELTQLHRDFDELKTACDNVRKGIFARHKKLEEADNFLLGMILQQQEEIEKLRSMLIKVKK